MSKCSSCATSSRCGHDHSSRAPQKPSLVDLEVVRQFFTVSFVRIAQSVEATHSGEMTQEDFRKKAEAIATRLSEIFCGYFSNYDEGPEDWNPHGLAETLRDILGQNGVWDENGVPQSDENVVFTGCEIFIEQSIKAVNDKRSQGFVIRTADDIPGDVEMFIEQWAMIFAGAPY